MRRRPGILAVGVVVAALAVPAMVDAANPKCTLEGTPGDDFQVTVRPGEVFCGGEGDDTVVNNYGTFLGEGGCDRVMQHQDGTFIGGDGDDSVMFWSEQGYFDGGPGDDYLNLGIFGSTFIGGDGNDMARVIDGGSMSVGGPGDDTVEWLLGRFIGGPGLDDVLDPASPGQFVPGPQ
jgi:hypothetical protein